MLIKIDVLLKEVVLASDYRLKARRPATPEYSDRMDRHVSLLLKTLRET